MYVLNAMMKEMINLFCGTGTRSRLIILTYHRVLKQLDPLIPGAPDKEQFAAQMRMLNKYFNLLTLSQAVRNIRDGHLTERAVCITFDDGYADNHEVAAPILKDLGIAATFFIATGYLNGGVMWNDRIIETFRHLSPGEYDFGDLGQINVLPNECRSKVIMETISKLKYLRCDERDRLSKEISKRFNINCANSLMMTDAMVKDLHILGMEIGAHTVSHPILARLDAAAAAVEVETSKTYLESLLQSSVTSFAYPNGIFGKDLTFRDVEIVRASGFEVAVTTDWGAVSASSNSWALPRVSLSGRNGAMALIRLCRDYRSSMKRVVG